MAARKKAPSPAVKKAAKKKTSSKKPRAGSRKTAGAAPFCIVGIGASAGGLEALEGLFSHMPSNTGMAFVIIQHLAPTHKSIMGSLLQKHTGMAIHQISDGVKVRPDCIYLNPPDRDVSLLNEELYLSDPTESHPARLPIDFFLRTLAADKKEQAICIILSGTGSDGTLGLKSVKGEGGMTMVQNEKQAKYDSMPMSAINTGMVDFTLAVEDMPDQLTSYIRHPYVKSADMPATPREEFINTIKKIYLLIRSKTGHDFSNYKINTIRRRIERRMAMHQIDRISDYLHYLQETPAEVHTLFKDMLITVTSFFRDPEAFDLLKEKVLPGLLKQKQPDSSVRIWVPGCATGEEAYSLAILIQEAMEKSDVHLKVQLFATDIDADAVEFARAGLYPESIAADVSEKRLKRYFTKQDSTYTVKKHIRETVVFAVQNFIKDPPFSRLDMVSCRNVLIYMDAALQKHILPLFHYVLDQNGILFLGTSEGIGESSDCFAPVSAKWKIFRSKGIAPKLAKHPALPQYTTSADMHPAEAEKALTGTSVRQVAESLILKEYAPAGVVINDRHEIIFFHGKTDQFLAPPAGEPSFNILKMAQEQLHYSLSTLIHRAATEHKMVSLENQKITHNNQSQIIDLIVRPLEDKVQGAGLTLVIFRESAAHAPPAAKAVKKQAAASRQDPRVLALQQELSTTKEYLQTTIEELETTNEELRSTNEELQSTNEELQSTNEEMETSREELQSTNEELETVNAELQSKVEELSRANNDLNNLLASTEIGTIFLDTDLRISRFTPAMNRLFNLIPADIGRPLTDITFKTSYEDLSRDAQHVLDTLKTIELEIESSDNKWFQMRIMPYRTMDNVIDGVVITFVDITECKEMEIALEMSRSQLKDRFQEQTDELTTTRTALAKEVSGRKKRENESALKARKPSKKK